LGGILHDKVADVLSRGHIFLNTSLTETFCLSMLEAASCGLIVVSTNVGGIPEVLPQKMAYLAKPNAQSLYKQLLKAIKNIDTQKCDIFHNFVKITYSWRKTAERTERVYNYAMK
jgi:phosphatidylinositol glycan class A protein